MKNDDKFKEDCQRYIRITHAGQICTDYVLYQMHPHKEIGLRLHSIIEDHIVKADAPDGHERIIDWPNVWREWEKMNYDCT